MCSFWIAAFLVIILAAESVVLPRYAPGAFRGKTLVLIRCERLSSLVCNYSWIIPHLSRIICDY